MRALTTSIGVIMILLLAIGIWAQALGAVTIDPSESSAGYRSDNQFADVGNAVSTIVLAGYGHVSGSYTRDGHYRSQTCRPGRVWVRGHHNRYGEWVRGHYRPVRWMAGHYNRNGRWVPGHCG
jgi:hypothetical protein